MTFFGKRNYIYSSLPFVLCVCVCVYLELIIIIEKRSFYYPNN